MNRFKDIYRVESSRLKGWDYSSAGCYFVTICTRDRECWLGKVVDGAMQLSPQGEIVADEWQKTATIREDVTLYEWVVMPNHVHGLIIIRRDVPMARLDENVTPGGDAPPGDAPPGDAPPGDAPPGDAPPGRLYKGTIGAIIGQFKSVCTKRIWAAGNDFAWQSRFHDEILRDEHSLEKVREYIRNNPLQWELDQENPMNLSAKKEQFSEVL